MLATLRETMEVEADEGVSVDVKSLKIEAIREELEYGGSRLRSVLRKLELPWACLSSAQDTKPKRLGAVRWPK